jgi:hypothetical protein
MQSSQVLRRKDCVVTDAAMFNAVHSVVHVDETVQNDPDFLAIVHVPALALVGRPIDAATA